MDSLVAGVVLAAGAGVRLRPLTSLRPKALCPVDNVPLVDLAIGRLRTAVSDVAVNVHHGRAAMEAHLGTSVHVSIEAEHPLGTAGALGHLRRWIDGRGALVVNADAWCPGSLADFVRGWDGERVRLLLLDAESLTPTSAVAAALMPWPSIANLAPEPSGLYEVVWAAQQASGRLEVVTHHGPFIDCGTPSRYLAANLAASGGVSVVDPTAMVEGQLDECVIWPGVTVRAGESLRRAIRATDHTTVLVR